MCTILNNVQSNKGKEKCFYDPFTGILYLFISTYSDDATGNPTQPNPSGENSLKIISKHINFNNILSDTCKDDLKVVTFFRKFKEGIMYDRDLNLFRFKPDKNYIGKYEYFLHPALPYGILMLLNPDDKKLSADEKISGKKLSVSVEINDNKTDWNFPPEVYSFTSDTNLTDIKNQIIKTNKLKEFSDHAIKQAKIGHKDSKIKTKIKSDMNLETIMKILKKDSKNDGTDIKTPIELKLELNCKAPDKPIKSPKPSGTEPTPPPDTKSPQGEPESPPPPYPDTKSPQGEPESPPPYPGTESPQGEPDSPPPYPGTEILPTPSSPPYPGKKSTKKNKKKEKLKIYTGGIKKTKKRKKYI